MLVLPRSSGDGLWIGPIFVRVIRFHERQADQERIVMLGVQAADHIPVIRAEHIRNMSDEQLAPLGYLRTDAGVIVPSQPVLRAA